MDKPNPVFEKLSLLCSLQGPWIHPYNIEFPERQTLPYLFYHSLSASFPFEINSRKRVLSAKPRLSASLYVVFLFHNLGALLQKHKTAQGSFFSILYCASS